MFERDKNNSNKTWKHINELLNKKCSSQNSTRVKELLRNDGSNVKVTSTIDIANTFNDLFASVGEKFASKIPVNNDSYINYLGPRQQETLFF